MDYRHSRNHPGRQNSADSPVCARPQTQAHENSGQQSLNAYSDWPEQELQAYYHDLSSAYVYQQQQQRQRNLALDITYPEADVHSETRQIHSSGWDIANPTPIETGLHSQHDSMHLHTYTGSSNLLPTDPSFSNTSNSTRSFYHHHCLTEQQAPSTSNWTGDDTSSYGLEEDTPSSVVRNRDMPKPAARPAGPKLRFTPEDDALLVDLKETKDLTWKQIADFFPGRSSGTLQVRYCTRLKAKEISWTETLVSL